MPSWIATTATTASARATSLRARAFVRTTVMSRPSAARAVVDAGLKASSVDSGMPGVWQRPDLRYVKASDEHGVLETRGAEAVSLGDALMLVPGIAIRP